MTNTQQNINESLIELKPTYEELSRAVASYAISRPGGVDAETNARLLDLAKRLGQDALPPVHYSDTGERYERTACSETVCNLEDDEDTSNNWGDITCPDCLKAQDTGSW